MASDDIGNLLNAGIQAAKAGKKAEARRLLEQVLERDDNNEVAWMWFASVVDTPRERRICLENVLEINPNNQQAREALERLGPLPGTGPLTPPPKSEPISRAQPISPRTPPVQPAARPAPPPVQRPTRPAENRARRRRPLNPTILIGGMALALVLIVVGLLMATNNITLGSPTPTNTAAVQTGTQGVAAAASPTPVGPTLTPNATFVEITATPLPTFTPLPTTTVSSLLPTPTLNLSSYALYFVGDKRGRDAAGIYTLKGDGTDETLAVKGDNAAFDVSLSRTGKLVYITQIDKKDQIASADADGSNPVILTKASGEHLRTPVWSPDGKKIAFVSDQYSPNQLYVMNADGSNVAPVTKGNIENRDPCWSPDGTKLIYASDPSGKKTYQLFELDLSTGKSTPWFASPGSVYSPTLSPDGKQIAFVSTRDRYPNIYIMNLTDKAPRLVSIGGGTSTNRDPAWSPDGQYIVFASDRDGGIFNLFVVTTDGKHLRQITKAKDNSYGPQFRPSAS